MGKEDFFAQMKISCYICSSVSNKVAWRSRLSRCDAKLFEGRFFDNLETKNGYENFEIYPCGALVGVGFDS